MGELNVVTVAVEQGGDDALLTNLYPRDTGLVCPNPAHRYLLDSLGGRWGEAHDPAGAGIEGWLEEQLRRRGLGRPYYWAQWVCGLDFLQPQPQPSPHPLAQSVPLFSRIRPHLPSLIPFIKARIAARQALHHQLAFLHGQVAQARRIPHSDAPPAPGPTPAPASAAGPSSGPGGSVPAFTPLPSLYMWKRVSMPHFYQQSPPADDPVGSVSAPPTATASAPRLSPSETGTAGGDGSSAPILIPWHAVDSSYYFAAFKQGEDQLRAWIEISPEYPIRPPTFRLTLTGRATATPKRLTPAPSLSLPPDSADLASVSSGCDNHLKLLERAVNTLPTDGDFGGQPHLLYQQLHLLESHFSALAQKKEPTQTRRCFAGRERRPFFFRL